MTPMHERPLIYVAGPYTNPDPVLNTRQAVQVGDELTARGDVTAYVPHISLLWHIVSPHDLEWWYEFDLSIVSRSDLLWRMDGASSGADAEVAYAEKLGIPVVRTQAEIDEFLANWLPE